MHDLILNKFGDHGAESSRRDIFQNHFAAKWCIEMLFDESISEVICEYGEDLVLKKNGDYELYQVKTKQESVSDWKLEDLIPIIAKTFAMAPYFGNVSRYCFVSNEGATGNLYDLKTIINQRLDTWNEKEQGFFDQFCQNNCHKILKEMQRVDPENKDTVASLKLKLPLLEIMTDFHHMEFIHDTNIRRLREAIEQNHISSSLITYTNDEIIAVYESIMGLVGKATIGRTRTEKTIVKEQVIKCLGQPLKRRACYRFPTQEEINQAPGRTRLERKLYLGGFTSMFTDDARELMVTVKNQARKWDFGQATELLEDVRVRVKHICVDNYDKVCLSYPDKEAVGRVIWDELKKDLPSLMAYYEAQNLLFIDDLFLKGIVWELTSECKLYWSQHPR
jgi:hypothetical protein